MLHANRDQSLRRSDLPKRFFAAVGPALNAPVIGKVLAAAQAFWRAPGQFRLPLFLIALGSGVASALALVSPFESREIPPQVQETIEVLVAKRSLAVGEVASRETLAVRKLPTAYAAESMLPPERIDEVDGSVLKQFLAAGEPLLRSQLEEATQRLRHPSLGMRLVQVVVEDRFGLQNLPSPGDHVDLFWQDQPTLHRGPGNTGGIFLLEDIAVKSIRRLKAEAGSASGRRNGLSGVVQVEVEVTPEHAIQLVRASSHGLLQMTLRHPADRGLLPLAMKPELPASRQATAPPKPERIKPESTPPTAPGSHASATSVAPRPTQPRAELAQGASARDPSQRAEGSAVEVIRGGQRSVQESALTGFPVHDFNRQGFGAGSSAQPSADSRSFPLAPQRIPSGHGGSTRPHEDARTALGEGEQRELTELLRGATPPASAEPRIVR